MANQKRTKNQIRREKAKIRKLDSGSGQNGDVVISDETSARLPNNADKERNITGVSPDVPQAEEASKLLEHFSGVFERFQPQELDNERQEFPREEVFFSGSDEIKTSDSESEYSEDDDVKPLSKRQKRLQSKVPLAVLKSSTLRPQLVEWFDVDARDPFMLVAMKSQPNTIQVPDHWMAKRDYLSNRKGIERLSFQLPKYIRDTGIQDMRLTDDQNLRQEQRNKVQPKMGRLDIDYQKLYDAFFKHQVPSRMYGFGDVYFEGKDVNDEYAELVVKIKPGLISTSLRKALELPENLKVPPPWISIMKEIGKPPAYKTLVIPGLDVEYSNTGYKENNSLETTAGDYWGKMHEYVDSSDSEEVDEEDGEEGEGEEIGDGEPDENDEIEEQPAKVPISEIGGHKKVSGVLNADDFERGPKSLYTILKEKTLDSSGSSGLNDERGYDLNQTPKASQAKANRNDNYAEAPQKKFKF